MAAVDLFRSLRNSFSAMYGGPYQHAAVITKSDADELEYACQSIYVGGTGHIKLKTVGGETVLFSAIPAGTILPVCATQVFSTDTTATLMVALW
jgi:hypothetical protein